MKKINMSIYNLGDHKLTMYTAEWCNPCKKIKPDIIELLGEPERTGELTKEEYKEKVFNLIPYFIITKDENIIEQLQSSNKDVVIPLINQYIKK